MGLKSVFKKISNTLTASIVLASVLIAALPATQVFAGANQCTWSGGGGNTNWSTAANWNCSVGTVPTDGYDLIFPYANGGVSNNDLVATNTYSSFWFTDNSSCVGNSYDIIGNALKLAGNITYKVDYGCHNQNVRIAQAFTLSTASTFAVDGILSFGSTLALGSNRLDISEASSGFVDPGTLTGTGALYFVNNSIGGSLWGTGSSPSYSGAVSITGGFAVFENINSLGTGAFTLEAGGKLQFDATVAGAYTFPNNITVHAATTITARGLGSIVYPAGHPVTTNNYGSGFDGTTTLNFSGTITLQANLVFAPEIVVTISGTLIGPSYTVTTLYGYSGSINITAATNTSATATGTVGCQAYSVTFSDSIPGNTASIDKCAVITITGTRSDIYVYDGGILKGTGTIGKLTSGGGIIAPGMSPGVLNTGNVTFDNSTTLQEELGGTGAGQFDQLNVTGTVSLGNAILTPSLYGGFAPSIGDSFVIINNDGSDAVTGTFAGLAEGATVSFSGYKFTISYTGGTGNDVVLTATYVPGPPGTGVARILRTNVILPAFVTILGFGLFFAQRRLLKTTN